MQRICGGVGPGGSDRWLVMYVGSLCTHPTYLGMYTEKQVLHMHSSEDLVDRHMVRDVEALFPKHELVITHGSVLFGGICPCYRLSTVVGISGAPVVLNGKAIG